MKKALVALVIAMALILPIKEAKAFDFFEGLATVLIVDEILTPDPAPVVVVTAPVAAPVVAAPVARVAAPVIDNRKLELMQQDIDYLLRQLHDLERKIRNLEK